MKSVILASSVLLMSFAAQASESVDFNVALAMELVSDPSDPNSSAGVDFVSNEDVSLVLLPVPPSNAEGASLDQYRGTFSKNFPKEKVSVDVTIIKTLSGARGGEAEAFYDVELNVNGIKSRTFTKSIANLSLDLTGAAVARPGKVARRPLLRLAFTE